MWIFKLIWYINPARRLLASSFEGVTILKTWGRDWHWCIETSFDIMQWIKSWESRNLLWWDKSKSCFKTSRLIASVVNDNNCIHLHGARCIAHRSSCQRKALLLFMSAYKTPFKSFDAFPQRICQTQSITAHENSATSNSYIDAKTGLCTWFLVNSSCISGSLSCW